MLSDITKKIEDFEQKLNDLALEQNEAPIIVKSLFTEFQMLCRDYCILQAFDIQRKFGAQIKALDELINRKKINTARDGMAGAIFFMQQSFRYRT